MAKKTRKLKGRDIPELTRINHTLHDEVDSIIGDYTEYRHTCQVVAMLAMQANGDKGITFNHPEKALKLLEEIEDYLIAAAYRYAELSDLEEGPEEKHRIGL
jgi:hypothetical protein